MCRVIALSSNPLGARDRRAQFRRLRPTPGKLTGLVPRTDRRALRPQAARKPQGTPQPRWTPRPRPNQELMHAAVRLVRRRHFDGDSASREHRQGVAHERDARDA